MRWRSCSVAADQTHHVVDGQPAYTRRFDAVLPYREPGLAPVSHAGQAWHIDGDGAAAYDRRFERTFGFYEGVAAVAGRDGWHHVDPQGRDLYSSRYSWCGNYQGGRCAVREGSGLYLHLAPDGAAAYGARWRYVGDFREGTAVVQADDGRSTHVDRDGVPMHHRWFQDLDVFHKGFACARDQGGWMHVDVHGQPVYRRRFARVEPFYNGQARVEQGDGRRVVIDERGETLVELRPTDLYRILPRDRAAVVFVRHAERPPLPAGKTGDDLPITVAGQRAAQELGASLAGRLRSLTTSPVRRCVETAKAIAEGARAELAPVPDSLLGGPGAFVLDADLAWENWLRDGNDGVVERLVRSDDAMPGMRPPSVAVAQLVALAAARLEAGEGVHVLVTHDAVLAPLVSRALGRSHVMWPDYLGAAAVWREGDVMRLWCDGSSGLVDP